MSAQKNFVVSFRNDSGNINAIMEGGYGKHITDIIIAINSSSDFEEAKKNKIPCIQDYIYKNMKHIDFLIYYRKHINKNEYSIKNFINLLIKNKINVNVVGDHYNNPNVNNYGRVSLKRIHYLLARTRFSIASTENLYSLFTMHCISNKVIIYINKNSYNKNIKYFSKNFIKFNFNSKSIKLKKRKITYKPTEFLNIKKTINVFFGSL